MDFISPEAFRKGMDPKKEEEKIMHWKKVEINEIFRVVNIEKTYTDKYKKDCHILDMVDRTNEKLGRAIR